MSVTGDIAAYLANMKPSAGQTAESFAREALVWQREIYSANAGYDIPNLEWESIGELSRQAWLRWARTKGAV